MHSKVFFLKKANHLFIATLSLLLFGCSAEQDGSAPTRSVSPETPYDITMLDGESAMKEVEQFLAIGPRPSGSSNSLPAAEYIRDQLKAAGFEKAYVDSFEDKAPTGGVTFHNVIAEIGNPNGPLILVGSHWDTKIGISDTFIGANDSGSSTGLLIDMAKIIAKNPPKNHAIMLAFFDGEECAEHYGNHDGLHGSKKLAEDLAKDQDRPVKGVMILDMIGDKDLTVTIPANSTRELVEMTLKAAHDAGARKNFRMTRMNILDDHVPFLLKGMPVVNIIDFEFGSKPGLNDYWHTDEDTIDKLSPESLESVGRVGLGVINRLMAKDD